MGVSIDAPSAIASLSSNPDEALKALQIVHPSYQQHVQSWQILLDAFEGSGGFLDGSYLWPYPREEQADFDRRKATARYHDYLSSLVDIYARMVCGKVSRSSTNSEYTAWTENVDGAGTTLDTLMRKALCLALVHGHSGALIDKTPEAPKDQTKAGEVARVVASIFPALAIADWRFDRRTLVAVKLLETAPEPPITEDVPTGTDAVQYLVWDTQQWARFDATGQKIGEGDPQLGLVPLVTLTPKPMYTSELLGRPLIGNANIIRAMLNRASEEDQVIRDQAFSLLTVSVGDTGNVEDAKRDLGNAVGTAKALVVKGTIDYKTPDQSVPGAIRENINYLVRELYRAAHVRYDSDSLQRESGASIRLQYTELNEALQGIAKAMVQAELQIARCWFAWSFPTPEAAQAAYEAAKVEARYPSEFITDDLIADLEAWAQAESMGLGETMSKRIKKKVVGRVDPNIPADELKKIHDEIDAQADEPAPVPVPLDKGDPEGQGIQQAMTEAMDAVA